jgi:hypothetical protein
LPFAVRRILWMALILVQGGWLGLFIFANEHIDTMSVMLGWWIFATLASAVALMLETADDDS